MTAVILPDGAPTGKHIKWKSINWRKVSMFVKRLQMRIAKAVKEKRSLQRLLTKSYYAKLLAVNASSIHIKRHIKIRGKANPFDPKFKGYCWEAPVHKNVQPSQMPIENVWQSL
ncbi:MAG: reverse transcriptase N-terminal domain-containing protein [Desulfobacterales bacterium]|nr:reverse transcriptase N-terminal domain-containing protein [Desulfobacterales bacterium]